MAFPVGHKHRVLIVVNKAYVGETLTDYPVLITEKSLPRNIFYRARSDGGDIRATSDASGATLIPIEMRLFDLTNKRIQIWVKRTLSTSISMPIYIWYGEPSTTALAKDDANGCNNVWNSGFKGVWHLNEAGNGTAGEYIDSTVTNNGARGGGGTADKVPAQETNSFIGNSAVWTDTGQAIHIAIPQNAVYDFGTGQFTIEGFTKYTSGTATAMWSNFASAGTGAVLRAQGNYLIFANFETVGVAAGSADTWQHWAVSRQAANNIYIYLNGVQKSNGNSASSITSTANNPNMGSQYKDIVTNTDGVFKLSSVRVSNTGRSANWCKFTSDQALSPTSVCELIRDDTMNMGFNL